MRTSVLINNKLVEVSLVNEKLVNDTKEELEYFTVDEMCHWCDFMEVTLSPSYESPTSNPSDIYMSMYGYDSVLGNDALDRFQLAYEQFLRWQRIRIFYMVHSKEARLAIVRECIIDRMDKGE